MFSFMKTYLYEELKVYCYCKAVGFELSCSDFLVLFQLNRSCFDDYKLYTQNIAIQNHMKISPKYIPIKFLSGRKAFVFIFVP